MSFISKNNAKSLITDNPLAQAATTVNVTSSEGANFPATGDFLCTIWDKATYPDPSDDSGMEIVKCTARSTDALTIVRAQEDTADVAHSQGEAIEMLITAGTIDQLKPADYILIRDKKTQNTNGGTFTSGAWRTRDLTEEVEDDGGHASLSSNQITLVAGTYRAHITTPAYAVAEHQAMLYNITDSEVVLLGTSEFTNSSYGVSSHSTIVGKFTITDTKVLEVRHRCGATKTASGFGTKANLTDEVYTIVELWKE